MRAPPDTPPASFTLATLESQQREGGRPYLEFLRRASMSAGLYVLEAGATDTQRPHAEDEAYYALSGRARLTVGETEEAVTPGSFVYVPKHLPHRFHSIEERLVLLVLFAPAESAG
ncbi:MAG TPA: cupin domain-containing protein [Myxococcus sp.]|nr:cupin domain-containing protein [Myxococcus sp.]